ncbi:MAG: hypothetical protein JOZ96_04885 [Acidobacteria bacterium]|nr:hypothetical protein [Acidobacteriota bacterium]
MPIKILVGCCCLLVLTCRYFMGCYAPTAQVKGPQAAQLASAAPSAREADERLLADVAAFASHEGRAEEAWARLNSRPQAETLYRLNRLSASLPVRDRNRVLIAFALCHLGGDYSANKQVVLSSLAKKPPYDEFSGDWAASLVIRLARRGDKSVLPHLFASADWADGATGADLQGFFTKELKSEPGVFLSNLEGTPPAIRQKVYGLLDPYGLSDADRRELQAYFKSVSKPSAAAPLADELLRALPPPKK